MNNIKICHITSVHCRDDDRIFLKECKTLSKVGFDVNLIVADAKGDETVDNIKIYDIGKPKNRIERILKTTKKVFKKALEVNAEIYHFHDPELIPIGLKLKKFGKKVIYDVHEDYYSKILNKDYIPSYIVRKVTAFFFNLFEKLVSKKYFDYIITADNHTKEKFNAKNAVRIANFIPLSEINLQIESVQNLLTKSEKEEYICVYVGGLSKNRGLLKMAEAIENMPYKIRLHLVGKFENQTDINLIKKYTKTQYLGFKPWNETIKIIMNADIGLLLLQPIPSYLYAGENTIKLFEYMFCGIPIITSNFKNLTNIIEVNNCGICVNPTNPKEIAKAIEYLITHPAEAKKMGENGKTAVLEKYNWEKESEKLIEVYTRLTGG